QGDLMRIVPESFTVTSSFTPRIKLQKKVEIHKSIASSEQKPLSEAEKSKFESLMPNLKWKVYPKKNIALASFSTDKERKAIYDKLSTLIKECPPLALSLQKNNDGKLFDGKQFIIQLKNIDSIALGKL